MKDCSIERPANFENIGAFSAFVEGALKNLDLAEESRQGFMMAVDEALTNVISYAYGGGPGDITINIRFNARSVSVELVDAGKEFDPTQQQVPDFNVPIEERKIGGMGIPLMRNFTDGISYYRKDGRNHFVLTKNIGGSNG